MVNTNCTSTFVSLCNLLHTAQCVRDMGDTIHTTNLGHFKQNEINSSPSFVVTGCGLARLNNALPQPLKHNSTIIKGDWEHHLKNLDIEIPVDQLIAITDWTVGERSLPE
jgi:hypothetical protein